MKNIHELLKKVWLSYYTLEEANRRFASKLAPNFSLFDFMPSDEMALSTYISSLLNPKGTHGQGDKYLVEFLKMIGSPQWLQNDDFASCEIITEKQANGQRRIDIYLEFKNGVIGIENKPWAGDQDNQLLDYAIFIENSLSGNNKDNWLLVYLSNGEPSESSMPLYKRQAWEQSGNLSILDFHSLLNWLEICIAKTQPNSVRVFIEELVKFIRSDINGELDMTNEKEIQELILDGEENLIASFQIFNSMRSIKEKLLENLQQQLETVIKDKNWELVWDINTQGKWKACSGFGIKFNSQDNAYLRFEFCNSDFVNLEWGMFAKNKANDEIRQEINDKLSKQFGGGYTSDAWPWYSADLNWLNEDKAIKDWYRHPLAWQMIQDKTLSEKVVALANTVHELLKDDLHP